MPNYEAFRIIRVQHDGLIEMYTSLQRLLEDEMILLFPHEKVVLEKIMSRIEVRLDDIGEVE